MIDMKPSIYGMTKEDLRAWLTRKGERPSRAELIWPWLYRASVSDFSAMTDLSAALIQKLDDDFGFDPLKLVTHHRAGDGTTKFLFRLADGHLIETVLMYQEYGVSVCVTTQVGCNIGCSFCASGLLSKQRDLTAGEITSQILEVNRWLKESDPGTRVTHITIMGIGEPFDNYDAVMRFLRIVTDQKGLCITPSHITVSTSGLVPKIRRFAHEGIPIRLAISLHAPTNEIRSQLMRINDAYPLEELMSAVRQYIEMTNHRVFFEYIMIRGLNDQPEHALALAELLNPLGKKAYVNLIPYNPVAEHGFRRSQDEDMRTFFDILMKHRVNCIRRREMGTDIEGACGQLRSQQIKAETDSILISKGRE